MGDEGAVLIEDQQLASAGLDHFALAIAVHVRHGRSPGMGAERAPAGQVGRVDAVAEHELVDAVAVEIGDKGLAPGVLEARRPLRTGGPFQDAVAGKDFHRAILVQVVEVDGGDGPGDGEIVDIIADGQVADPLERPMPIEGRGDHWKLQRRFF